MPIKLFVDQLTDDKTMGMTTNHDMMLHNAEALKVVWEQDPSQSPIVFKAGRFVGIIMTSAVEDGIAMTFIDLKKEMGRALFVAEKFESKDFQKQFMEVFEKVNTTYSEKYNEVELVVDKNFTPNILAN